MKTTSNWRSGVTASDRRKIKQKISVLLRKELLSLTRKGKGKGNGKGGSSNIHSTVRKIESLWFKKASSFEAYNADRFTLKKRVRAILNALPEGRGNRNSSIKKGISVRRNISGRRNTCGAINSDLTEVTSIAFAGVVVDQLEFSIGIVY
eukprot:CAMPEP_0178965176 /NCGR_PEP_ID=MMETSP0789-20121207/16119_1 /TAXON_ID=3005 /ORGANISM="Rhizosolenia setigera, Strain CCMP 1694" /LENGTH=149 /DNA_ID=CAMNT_0020650097 /DNA_START=102 /DNA_END=551 /DNA_ORIENTATION=-